MEMLVINGSPRKDRNTAALLKYAMDGAAAAGAVSNLIHLYELDFKGCCSCFSTFLFGRKLTAQPWYG
ncbi:NAD(P)H-dependent oxidoreductase [uncultured Blautia sp.]|uniref:NAD(P)H-dependent oxidoreductase n=1 Tax=Blautia marasmi TaxID=1917868 RepID=UPI002FE6D69D